MKTYEEIKPELTRLLLNAVEDYGGYAGREFGLEYGGALCEVVWYLEKLGPIHFPKGTLGYRGDITEYDLGPAARKMMLLDLDGQSLTVKKGTKTRGAIRHWWDNVHRSWEVGEHNTSLIYFRLTVGGLCHGPFVKNHRNNRYRYDLGVEMYLRMGHWNSHRISLSETWKKVTTETLWSPERTVELKEEQWPELRLMPWYALCMLCGLHPHRFMFMQKPEAKPEIETTSEAESSPEPSISNASAELAA